ncbi:MAG: hypothetical protein COU08_02945 [Candidatus Harrisonbacteria bacterium CG10_big_fil_rev_8_21_14_0_10_42_17]|uniref:VIT family protein n=1 Tax=Candidatus Harrisonbacteria bacterium CG10_big_fil_rev_8_21_14_0_10_42_17 TaxID=1974584 RepID=A0A2M6WHS6_9BACT|nr:MAG: hypothetical protein COU08_02945 [Candidatus Harrisonbacteria bacterium CG10_big_fil_rev_8_21_14_0_10_42_17]
MEQHHTHTSTSALYVRNFIFGVEDSLVSTVGLLSGIAIADVPRTTIFLVGIVLIFVEAFSMGVGSFLSEHSVKDYLYGGATKQTRNFIGSVIMFLSYFASGFIPLAPYIILPTTIAFWVSIVVSCGALLLLGYVSARLSHTSVWRSSLRMFLIGGAAIVLGVLVGRFTSQL